jgi:glycosyltransferase involved in cell wall biosynthesis
VASPTKFGEYLACGLPVIATPHVHAVRQAITDGQLGFLVTDEHPDQPAQLARFVNGVMDQRNAWLARCRTYAEERLSWDHFGNRIEDIYTQLIMQKQNVNGTMTVLSDLHTDGGAQADTLTNRFA